MDFALTPIQEKWWKLATELVPVFRKRARRYDETGEFPEENFKELRDCGILKLGVPVEFGGADVGNDPAGFVQNLVVEKISEGCSSTGWSLMIHWVNCQVVNHIGSLSTRRRVLGDVAKNGALIGSLGSEVNTQDAKAGNVAPQLQIVSGYRPVQGGFVVNGKKHFCTVAPVATYLLFWGLAPGTSRNDEGLTISVIPKDKANITFDRAGWDDCVGLRATASWSANLTDVFVPWSDVLGQPGDFVQNDPYTFDLAHIAHLLGTARGVFDHVVQVVKEREYLQRDQVYMYWLAEMHGALVAARSSYLYCTWLWEQGRFDECLLASYDSLHTARQVALMISDKSFEICGTRALFKFLPLERAGRDIRTAALHTRDTQLVQLQVRAILNGGKIFSKQKYGEKLTSRRSWQDLGIGATEEVA